MKHLINWVEIPVTDMGRAKGILREDPCRRTPDHAPGESRGCFHRRTGSTAGRWLVERAICLAQMASRSTLTAGMTWTPYSPGSRPREGKSFFPRHTAAGRRAGSGLLPILRGTGSAFSTCESGAAPSPAAPAWPRPARPRQQPKGERA